MSGNGVSGGKRTSGLGRFPPIVPLWPPASRHRSFVVAGTFTAIDSAKHLLFRASMVVADHMPALAAIRCAYAIWRFD
jgi:hypothetical protein